MAEFRAILTDFFTVAQFIFLAASLVMAVILYRLIERERKQRLSNTQSDLTNMMILFQTMRDMLRQQKDLARQLNESLDKKVILIRQTVDSALKDLDALRENVRVVSLRLEKTSEELSSVQKQVAYAREDQPQESAPRHTSLESPDVTPDHLARTPIPPSLHVLGGHEPNSSAHDVIDNWVGLDFGAAMIEEPAPEVHVPSQPSDAEAARQAFRALLNLDESASAEDPRPNPDTPVAARPFVSGNGKSKVTPIQARVYEYSDAGMSVAQISTELGIGKGEVRLILGLRSDKER
ncbi:MAG: hypothetical protein HZB26_03100 [Candidatus Hydrogenedentes bacterium]|nr:hypothetical protein [Candidatus Hydrogenedentota bacterium]